MDRLTFLLKSIKPNKLLIFDTVGAIISSAITGLLLVPLSDQLGIQKTHLTLLAIIPIGFVFFNLINIVFRALSTIKAIVSIAILNIAYCVLSVLLLLQNSHSITGLAITYFVLEICLVLTLAFIEFGVSRYSSN